MTLLTCLKFQRQNINLLLFKNEEWQKNSTTDFTTFHSMQHAIEIYKTKDEQTQPEVQVENDTVWTQIQMTKLFQRDRTVITKHISNIFKEGELDEKSNVQKMPIANSG